MSIAQQTKPRRFVTPTWFWVLALFVAVFGSMFGGLWLYSNHILEKNIDLLFQQVLGEGDAATAYKEADVRFQAAYSRADFLEFADKEPHLFRRDKLTGVKIDWLTQRGSLYVRIKTRVDDGTDRVEIDFYCRPAGRDQWRLIGIAPDLVAAVPK